MRSAPPSLECEWPTSSSGVDVVEVLLPERLHELVGGQLAPARVGDRLHLLREVDLEAARQVEVVLRPA